MRCVTSPHGPPSAPTVIDGLDLWLGSRTPAGGLPAKTSAVVNVLLTQPRLASYSGASEVARLAGANVATVTRTAQALGFRGWPALQQELRARYLSSLSAAQVAAEHGNLSDAPGGASVRRDLDAMAQLSRDLDEGAVKDIAAAIAGSRRTLTISSGSFAAVGLALSHNVGLAGYESQLHRDVSAEFANALARCGPGDVLVAISFWRLYVSAVHAAQLARSHGLTVCVITDTRSSELADLADHLAIVPAEGVSFAPSLTPAISMVQAISAELASIDPDLTRATVAGSDQVWREAGLLKRSPRRPTTPLSSDVDASGD